MKRRDGFEMRPWKCSARALALAAGAWPLIALGQGDGTFDSPLRIAIQHPLGVAAGRFNADARLDLAVVDGVGKLTVLLQGARGRSDWTAGAVDAAGFFVRAADFDADDFDDLVVAHPGASASFRRCRGDGTFEEGLALAETRGARWAAAADLDGDGALDLATANHSATSVAVFLGSGDGRFNHLATHHFAGWPHSIEAADLDGDGTLDLAVGLPEGIELLRGVGGGRFIGQGRLAETWGCHQFLSTGDFNQDGLPDLLTPCGAELNLGGWAFRRSLEARSWSAAVVDLDGDGPLDVALAANDPAGSDQAAFLVHRGESDGNFQPASVSHAFGLTPSFLLGRDLDGDGRGDLIATDPQSWSLAVFWGKPEERFLGVGFTVGGFAAARTAAVGDLDADGRPDLFIQDFLKPRVQVYLGPGLSEPDAPSLTIETGALYTTLEVVDLDRDGIPDLAGASRGAGTALAAILDRRGSVLTSGSWAAGLSPSALAVERLDAGETPDLAVACSGSNHVAVLLGQGAGRFAEAPAVPTVDRPKDVAAGDLDGDGLRDLVVVASREVAVHFGKGGGEFEGPLPLVHDAALSFGQAAVAEVTGDGPDDLLVSELRSSTLRLYLREGGRVFREGAVLQAGGTPVSMVVADLNGDGLLDLTAAGHQSRSVTAVLNRGAAGWGPPADSWAGFGPLGHHLVDFDGDGALDVLLFSEKRVLVYQGRRPAPGAGRFLRGDADGDGRLAVNDPIAVLGRLFLGGPPLACEDAADADDDGVLAVADPIAALNHLFLGAGPLPAPGPGRCGEDPTPDPLPPCAGTCR